MNGQFIMNVDEGCFEAFAPLVLKRFLENMEELAVPRTPSYLGVDLAAVGDLILTTVMYTAVFVVLISPQNAMLEDSRNALCGGKLDWAYGTDPFGHTYWSTTPPPEEGLDSRPWSRPADEVDTMTFNEHLLDLVVRGRGHPGDCNKTQCDGAPNETAPGWGYDICCWPQVLRRSDIQDVQRLISDPIDDISLSWNSRCSDVLDEGGSYAWGAQWASIMMSTLADQVKNESCAHCTDRFRSVCDYTGLSSESDRCGAPTCDALAELCHANSITGKLTRMYCGEKCGCDTPNSSLVHTGTGSGCSPSCRATYWATVAKQPCADELPGSAGLKVYTDSLSASGSAGAQRAAEKIRSWGCKGAMMGLDACGSQAVGEDRPFGIPGFKSIKHLCPVTCQCKGGVRGCPESCPRA